jgi:two-component system, NarL family, sensor histidine kinase NreB
MPEQLKILMLEDTPADAEIIQRLLLKEKLRFEFSLAINKEAYLLALDQFVPDVILSDNSLPQFNSVDALEIARQRFPGIPFIMVTGAASEEFAADIIKSGADDYILKDRLNKLPAAIDTALKQRKAEREKQQAEQRLIQSEEKYRTLVEQAFDGIIIYSPEGVILDCNHSACNAMGYTQKELKGLVINELFFEKDLMARPLYFKILKSGQPTLDYRRLKRKDGTYVEMEIGTKMMPDGNLMAIGRDITGRKEAEQKIIQSETNLRAIFENTSEGFLLLDSEGIVKAFNKNSGDYAFFLKEKKMQVGDLLYDFIEPARIKLFKGIIAKVLTGKSVHYDRAHDLEGGKTRWTDFSITPVIEAGRVKGICITGRDITENKTIEQQREFDHNNLHALINNTNDLMWSVDRDFKLISFNNAFEQIVSAVSGQAVKKGNDILKNGFRQEQLERFKKFYERAFTGESFTEIDYGTGFCTEISFYPIYKGNTIIGTACFSRDITERKKAEKEITDYKNALDQSSIVSITDKKGIIKHVNGNFCKISGYTAMELLGQDHRIINSGYHPKPFIKNLWTTIASGKIWRGEFCNKAKDGSLYWVDATIVPFLDDKGKPVQYIAIRNDITEKKMMEQEILNQKIQEQKKMTRAIIKAQEKERNHIGQELHDNINQILASTKLYLSMAGSKNEQLKDLIKYPMELIDNSIDEIRLLSSKHVTPEKDIDLEELIQSLLDHLHANTGIKTVLCYSKVKKSIHDDLKLNIYRIIQEQVNNIVKHAVAKNVSVSVEADDNAVYIIVTDDGKGFNLKAKRNGIGISNMANRVESFNGEMIIESTPGNGCKVQIKIPY